jgi:hypothetical protein
MSAISTAALATSTLDDDAWEDLLSFIEERRVIPIVGPELLMVTAERSPRLLFDWAAERLAARLNVNTAELPKPYTLNDVVRVFLAGLVPEMRATHDVRQWRARILEAQQGAGSADRDQAAAERAASP